MPGTPGGRQRFDSQSGGRSSALAILIAVGRFHSEWNSTWMSILSPTALRIFSKGTMACFRSALEM